MHVLEPEGRPTLVRREVVLEATLIPHGDPDALARMDRDSARKERVLLHRDDDLA